MTDAWAPLCMEPGEWAEWTAHNPRLRPVDYADRPCHDCPLGYAADMRSKGKCNGTPGGVAEGVDTVVAHLTVTSPPCDTCAHAPICRIREQVQSLTGYTVVAPDDAAELDPGVSVSAVAIVECSYYLKVRGGVRVETPAKRGWTDEQRAAQGERLRTAIAAKKAREAA